MQPFRIKSDPLTIEDYSIAHCFDISVEQPGIDIIPKLSLLGWSVRIIRARGYGHPITDPTNDAVLVRLIGEVRTELKRQGINVNGDDWQKALDLDLMIDLLKRGDVEKARAVLLGKLKAGQK